MAARSLISGGIIYSISSPISSSPDLEFPWMKTAISAIFLIAIYVYVIHDVYRLAKNESAPLDDMPNQEKIL